METRIPEGADWVPWMFRSRQPCATFSARSRKTADGYCVVCSFDGREFLLTEENLELCREPKGADGEFLGTKEALSITHPPGTHAVIEYRGEFRRHPGLSEDDTVEHWKAEIGLCDGSSHMMTYLGMPQVRAVSHTFTSANEAEGERLAARTRKAEAARDAGLFVAAVAVAIALLVGLFKYWK